jgi:hypothetical protein
MAAEKGAFKDIVITPDLEGRTTTSTELRADAREVAALLKIEPFVERLRAAKAAGQTTDNLPRPLLNAKLLCLWKISECLLEVRKFVAAIDYDLASSNIALDSLVARRNQVQNTLNTINFMQGGTLGAIKQGMALHGEFSGSQYPGMVSFGLGTTLASLNLVLPSIWVRRIDAPPNSLSYFLRQNHQFLDAQDSQLWQFLESPIPGSKWTMSRREVLVHHWEDLAGLQSTHERLLRRLSSVHEGPEHLTESIGLIGQRLALLHDLKTHIEEFDGSLYELHKAIQSN